MIYIYIYNIYIYTYTVYISYNNDFEAFANGLRCLKYYTRQYFLLGIQDWPSPNGERSGPQKWDGNSTSNIQQHQ